MTDMNTELISCIVPCFNNIQYLNACISSLLLQSYSNIEILLIDDGSDPEYADYYDRFESQKCHIYHIPRGG